MSNEKATPSVIDIDRCQLYTKAPGTESERASLLWQMYNANTGMGWNPRITVWTRTPGDEKKPPITAALNVVSAHCIIDQIELACSAEPGYRSDEFTCEGNKYDKDSGDKLPGIHVLSKVVVGKDKDGCVWIAVLSEDESRPRIQFKYGLGDYHHFIHRDGTRYTEAEMSVVAARACVRVLRATLDRYTPLIDDDARKSRAEAREARKSRYKSYSSEAPKRKTEFDELTF